MEAHSRMYPETLVGFYSQYQQPSERNYITNNFVTQNQPPVNNQVINDTLMALL